MLTSNLRPHNTVCMVFFPSSILHPRSSWVAASPLCILCGSPRFAAMGQAVLAPPPPEFMQQAPPSFIPTGTNLLATMPPLTPAPSGTVPEWLDWGPVGLRPHVLDALLCGDGIPCW